MSRLRRAWSALSDVVGHVVGRAVAPFRPAPGTTEGAVQLGLVMLALGLGMVWIPAALIVPGSLLVAIGLGFTLRRGV